MYCVGKQFCKGQLLLKSNSCNATVKRLLKRYERKVNCSVYLQYISSRYLSKDLLFFMREKDPEFKKIEGQTLKSPVKKTIC